VRVRAAVLGSTAAIARHRVTIGKRVAELSAGTSPFTLTVTLRRGARVPKRVRVQALDAAGRPLTASSRLIIRQRKGKGGVGSGPGVGT
jgi:hypothetical protein